MSETIGLARGRGLGNPQSMPAELFGVPSRACTHKLSMSALPPIATQKRTSFDEAMCHKRTWALAAKSVTTPVCSLSWLVIPDDGMTSGAPSSTLGPCQGKRPRAVEDFCSRAEEAHRVIPPFCDRQAVLYFAIAPAELDCD